MSNLILTQMLKEIEDAIGEFKDRLQHNEDGLELSQNQREKIVEVYKIMCKL